MTITNIFGLGCGCSDTLAPYFYENKQEGKCGVVLFLATLWLPTETKTADNQKINSLCLYPDPGSNRDGSESTGV